MDLQSENKLAMLKWNCQLLKSGRLTFEEKKTFDLFCVTVKYYKEKPRNII